MAKGIKNPFATTLTLNDFLSGDVAVTTTAFTEIGRKIMVAGQGLALGYDNFGGQSNAAGRIYCDFKTAASAAVNGRLRIDIEDANQRVIRTLWEGEAASLRMGAAARSERMPLPIIKHVITEDQYMVLKFKGQAAVTIAKAQSAGEIDCTAFDTYDK